MNPIDKRVDEYAAQHGRYVDFAGEVRRLIGTLLSEAGIDVHAVTCRAKSPQSLRGKLEERPERAVTDLAGVRVIAYFADDVDKIAQIVESEFAIDSANSVDKREPDDPSTFGYASLHYVLSLSSERAALPENAQFAGMVAEIQIRTVLQHAWAEIEHDFGYKTAVEIPSEYRRRFARLAGVLELADEEFISIRNGLASYGEALPAQLEADASAVELNRDSLAEFVAKSEVLAELAAAIASAGDTEVYERGPSELTLGLNVAAMHFVGVATIGELERILEERKEQVRRFAEAWLADGAILVPVSHTIGLYYLAYAMIGESGNAATAMEYLEQMGIGQDDERNAIAQKIVRVAHFRRSRTRLRRPGNC